MSATLARARTPASGQVHLRLTADGNAYRFEMSPDGAVWRGVGGRLRGTDRGVRARGADQRRRSARAKVRFVSARLEE